jgi:hypothetical protein
MVIEKLLDEWDYERNGPTDGYSNFGRKKVWWICKRDSSHRWLAVLNNRAKGTGCPYCAGRLASKENALSNHSKIVSEIHPKNGSVDASKITQFSSQKLWWLCSENHEWKATVASRVSGQGCPFCKGKKPTETHNLLVIFPKIASEWSSKNDSFPKDYLPFSSKKVFWQCNKGHEWKASIRDRTLSGSGCHICSGYVNQHKCEISEDGLSKKCNCCNEMKLKSEFRGRKSRGYWINSICRKCESDKVVSYRTMTKEGIVAEILRRKRHVCAKEKIPFNLTKEFILNRLNEIEWKCELTGLPLRSLKTSLDEKYQGFQLDSLSVDRINHKGGYTTDNVRFVLNQVNIFRSNASDERMYEVAEALLKKRNKQ